MNYLWRAQCFGWDISLAIPWVKTLVTLKAGKIKSTATPTNRRPVEVAILELTDVLATGRSEGSLPVALVILPLTDVLVAVGPSVGSKTVMKVARCWASRQAALSSRCPPSQQQQDANESD